MTTGLLDAFDSISWSETLLARLHTASAELSRKQGLAAEKEWLGQAVDRVTAARDGIGDVLTRAMRLPELEGLREDHARALQQAAVDSIERLQAGITFHVGARAPILEALFGKLKYPVIRRADKEDFERFASDFEKRLSSSYCKRMFADQPFQFAGPVLDEVRAAFAAWRAVFSAERLPVNEETAIRDELEGLSRRLELPMRQARSLAEAALAPLRNAFDESGLANRPKRRLAKPSVTESADRELTEESMGDLAEAESLSAELSPPAPPEPEAAAAVAAPKKPRKSKKAVDVEATNEQ